ncbi:radical SAM protein [Candidatus Bathyarchaeota archaeon]|nr:radical SAM protein [Candidatus Bathyarchaeota archaeon]
MNICYVNAGNAGSIGLDEFLNAPPLALMCLTPTVPQHKKYLIDLKANPMPEDKVRRIIQKGDLIAISSFTPSIKNARKIAAIAKQYNKPVVIGGYHASLIPEVCKEPMFDVAVRREGELTFPELVHLLERDGKWTKDNLKTVKGIAYEHEGEMRETEPQPLVKNLDDLPMPDRDLIGNTKYEYFGASLDALESSRGCIGNCHFCCVQVHCGGIWRKKSPERVVREIAECSRKTKWISYQDSELTINMKRVKQICDLVIEHGYDNQWYGCQARADDLVREPKIVERMVESGFKFFFIGIESKHQKSLDVIGKRVTTDVIREAVEMCHDLGAAVYGAIIIGNIGETYEEVLETIDYAIELNLDIAQFTSLTPYPGTKIWDDAVKNGWIEDADWTHYDFTRTVMRTPDLTRKQVAELVHHAYKKFYIGDLWGEYFWKRAPRFFFNRQNWWFFKMLPGFMKNIDKIERLVSDLSKPTPIEEFTGEI